MNSKKMIAVVTTAMVLVLGAAVAGAQDATEPGEGFRRSPRSGSELVLEYTGLTHEELREELQGGTTIAELIEANGESVDAFIAEATVKAQERLADAVEAGRLTEEEAAEKAVSIEERITERLNGTFEPDRKRGTRGPRH